MSEPRASKTATDEHWDARARQVDERSQVNIEDVHQRELELDFVLAHVEPSMVVLEAGCGNGFTTARLRERVSMVDGFDFSEAMVERARQEVGERNNRFHHASVLDLGAFPGNYDAVVCVRVLINLSDLEEQRRALANLAGQVRPGGRLILVEGFADGFEELDRLRAATGLEPIRPASINFYSREADLVGTLGREFAVRAEFDTGTMDVLTRVVLPALLGADSVRGVTPQHARLLPVARALPVGRLREWARVRGWVFERRER